MKYTDNYNIYSVGHKKLPLAQLMGWHGRGRKSGPGEACMNVMRNWQPERCKHINRY